MKQLLTGNEALARGAWEAGAVFASAYPGTPSTEILENLTAYPELYAEWAPNEKAALEAAAGASLAGGRAMVSMKHVGVNVAADPLFTLSYTGVNAGLVLVSADEPGMYSSQNEQDNRHYAHAAKLAMLEPADSAECREMTLAAFELSEAFDVPVMIRVTTRVCHSKSTVECGERTAPVFKEYVKDPAKNLMVPAAAMKRRIVMEQRASRLLAASEASPFNVVIPAAADSGGRRVGVVTSGICFQYAREVFGDSAAYLKLGFTCPLPDALLKRFAATVDTVYVVEEDDPLLEQWVKACGIACTGKDIFPAYGEMTPDVLRRSLGRGELPAIEYDRDMIVPRPPTLCAGCPHRGLLMELGKRRDTVVSGDIGCYTLGFAPPYNALDTCVCMGASFSIAHGMQKAFDLAGAGKRVVGVLGDSTFFHTGINSLMEVLYNNSRAICIVLDNHITGMTGHQENPGSGKRAGGDAAPVMDIAAIVRALGVKWVAEVNPNDLAAVRKALDDAYAREEPSVIITKWPCVLKRMDAGERAAFGDPFTQKCTVIENSCIGCKICLRGGCPALSVRATQAGPRAEIDAAQCVGCEVCAQLCPKNAIVPVTQKEAAK